MFAPNLNDEETVKTAVIYPEVALKGILFVLYLHRNLRRTLYCNLKNLITNEMLVHCSQTEKDSLN